MPRPWRRLKKLCHPRGGSPRGTPAGHTARGVVPRRDAGRAEEQAHLPLGPERLASPGHPRSTHPIDLSVRCGMSRTWNRRRPRAARLQHRSHAASSRRDRHQGRPWCPRDCHPRSSRLARRQGPRGAAQHLAPAAAAARARAQQPRKYLAVHPPELAVEPHLQILRRHRRSLLLCLEHPHRSALENHVHRPPRLGGRRSLFVRVGIILRLDMAARSDELKAKLQAAPDWDLVICDEAHRMAASYFGGEVKETRRYKLGKLLGTRTRNLLLMSATPHNGKEADFQLFMGLLDADRFEGRFREGIHKADVSDMMRRLIKEELYRMDGTPLFPERRAYTAGYALSPEEVDLYQAVTTYVRDEMNRADRTGDGNRRTSVGFALQILQRRLASSPAAIHRSLERRRKRLEERLREEKLMRLSGSAPLI